MFLNELYSEHMKYHAFGRALYHPTLNSAIHIGACGYFDESGNWHYIGDIADQDFASKLGLDPIDKEDLKQAPTDKSTWECLLAERTKSRVFSIEAKATLVCIPTVELGQLLTSHIPQELKRWEFPLPPKLGLNSHPALSSVPFSSRYPPFIMKHTTT